MPRSSDTPRIAALALAPALAPTRAPRYRYVRRRWWVLFTVFDALGWLLVSLARRIGAGCGRRPTGERLIRRILIVQLDHLGDAILSTGMLGELARRYPQARMEVLAAPWNAELFAALPQISHVHICRWNRFARRGGWGWPLAIAYWGWQLRRQRFDLGIDLRGEFPLALLLWLAGVERRVGWAAGGGGFLLTDSAEYVPTQSQAAARARLLDAIDRLPPGTNAVPQPHFEATPAARVQVAARVAMLPAAALVVAHIAAGTQAKRWPTSHWQELLGRLILQLDEVQIVLVGSADDGALARETLGGQAWPRVWNWTGSLSVCELAALLEQASCFVGADSGPAHLAAAVGTPAVVLFSGTNDPRVWRPSGDVVVVRQPVACAPCHRTHCPLADHPCMRGIEPEQVAAAIVGRLAPRHVLVESKLEPAA